MLEKDIVAAILRHLKQRPRCFAWKTHGGTYGTAGIPDVIACVNGRFCAFEVKQPGKNPSRLQAVILGKLRAAGGIACVVTSVAEVKEALDGPADTAEQVCLLNQQIDAKLKKSAQLRAAGRLAEHTALEREIDRDIDALVDLRAGQSKGQKGGRL